LIGVALSVNPLLFVLAVLVGLIGLALAGWKREQNRVARYHSRPPARGWENGWRAPSGAAEELDREWRELGYLPLGTLRIEGQPPSYEAIYAHPTLPIYGAISVQPDRAVPYALSFWEGGGFLLTTALPLAEARAAALDTGTARLVQLRVAGRPLALDGQHVGTVKAWALGKRTALPATREALVGYLADDYGRVHTALKSGRAVPFNGYVRGLAGRPERVLTF
jgi:hypothetical protein